MKEKLFEIVWNDVYHLTDSWCTNVEIAEAYKESRFQVTNIGWLIFEDKTYGNYILNYPILLIYDYST